MSYVNNTVQQEPIGPGFGGGGGEHSVQNTARSTKSNCQRERKISSRLKTTREKDFVETEDPVC